MFRILQTKTHKPLEIATARTALTTGEVVTRDYSGVVSEASSGMGEFFVDCPKTYTGLNSVYNPADSDSDSIALGAKCNVVPTMLGERYATDQVTPGYADIGDPMVASSGKMVRAGSTAAYQWIYGGTYSDPTGTLYVLEKVHAATAPATRTVTYEANGGSRTMTDPRSPYYVGKVVTVLPNGFSAPTYKDFSKWNTAANGSGTNYNPADEITVAGSNIALYAQYVNSYTLLVLDANGGTGTMTDTEHYLVDDVITIPDSTFTPPSGKVFSKWNTLANGTGTDYDPEAEITVTSGMIGAATTLYAVWANA